MAKKADKIAEILKHEGFEKKELEKLTSAQLDDLLNDLEGGCTGLKSIEVTANGKVIFNYYESDPQMIKFDKDKRTIIMEIIRNAKNEINFNSKPKPKEELIENTLRSAFARICFVAINVLSIENEETKKLFLPGAITINELYEHPAISMKTLKAIADCYCETEKLEKL